MALKSDIYQSSDNRTLNLQERKVITTERQFSRSVLDLRQGKQKNVDNDFFFEFLPTAGTLTAPPIELGELKESAAKQYRRATMFVRRHPRYFILGLLVLAAILLFSLSAMTHRTIIKSRPQTPSSAATSVTESSLPQSSPTATAGSPPQPSASVQSQPGVGGPTTAGTGSNQGSNNGTTTTQPNPPDASVSDPKICVADACLEVTSPLLEPVNPLIPEEEVKL